MSSIFQNNDVLETTASKQCEVFEFQNEHGHIKHVFEKREISVQINGETYYDLVSPAGFGGPRILNCQEEEKWDLIFDFQKAFEAYCLEHRIVSEEVAFNPPFGNAVSFLDCYEVEYVRDIFGIDLTKPLEQIGNEDLSELWNALDEGVEYRVIEGELESKELKQFISQLDIKNLSDVIYNPNFSNDFKVDGFIAIEIIFEGKILATSLSVIWEEEVYSLGDSRNSNFQYYKTEIFLKCALYVWATEKNLKKIWCKQESSQTRMAIETLVKPVCIGRKIWNRNVFQKICMLEKGSRN